MIHLSASLYGCLVVASLFSNAWGATVPPRVVHERRASAPEGYTYVGVAADDYVLQMRVNLAMGNQAGLEDALAKISDPSSPTYGQWLSRDEVASYAAPSLASFRNVSKCLKSYGIEPTATSAIGDGFKFNVTVGIANKMLSTNYAVYKDDDSGKLSVQTLEYSVPEDLQDDIIVVHPTTSFIQAAHNKVTITGQQRTVGRRNGAGYDKTASCNNFITPACLQDLYLLPTTPIGSDTKSSIGVSGFTAQNANKDDLKTFLKTYRPDMSPDTTFDTQLIDDGVNDQNASLAGMEANLDVQYTVGLANGIPTTFIDVGDNIEDGDDKGFLDITDFLINEKNPPLVVTTSYGVGPFESSLSMKMTYAICNAFLQLTARGVSILYATGDGGVASSPGVECDNEPFQAAWPTCPYATLVGATGSVPEKGADLSAGGFSNYFPRQSWQSSAVSGYLDQIGDLYAGRYNTSGRAYPDVSAQGVLVTTIVDGKETPVNGTSCSSPIFASIIALLNDERLRLGKPPMGFLNPWIYANTWAFNDITEGSNPGCGTDGFPAKVGWDPVTGVGSPNYPAMRKAAGLP